MYVYSDPSGDISDPVDNVEHVVVIKAGGSGPEDAMQPTRKVPVERSAENRFGVKRTARSMVATFPPAAIALGNEIRVVYTRGEYTREVAIKLEADILGLMR